jgi:hypothetical protein
MVDASCIQAWTRKGAWFRPSIWNRLSLAYRIPTSYKKVVHACFVSPEVVLWVPHRQMSSATRPAPGKKAYVHVFSLHFALKFLPSALLLDVAFVGWEGSRCLCHFIISCRTVGDTTVSAQKLIIIT